MILNHNTNLIDLKKHLNYNIYIYIYHVLKIWHAKLSYSKLIIILINITLLKHEKIKIYDFLYHYSALTFVKNLYIEESNWFSWIIQDVDFPSTSLNYDNDCEVIGSRKSLGAQ
jgi:hypothetical protein